MPDSPFGDPGADKADQGIAALSRSVIDAALSYFQARLLLLRIESKEASSVIARRFALFLSASTLFSLAYFVAIAAGISLLAERLDIRWEYVAFWVAGAHAFLAILIVLIARAKFSRPLFENSLKELEKDRQWLQNRKGR